MWAIIQKLRIFFDIVWAANYQTNGEWERIHCGVLMENELNLRITDLARGGSGVAKDADGRVIFVPFSAPGDLLRVKVLETHKNYAHGAILEILEPSADRQEPPCP